MTLPPRNPPSSPTQGFTLVELLVVLIVLALAAAMLAPRLLGMIEPHPERDLPLEMQDRIDRMRSDAIFKARQQVAVIDYLENSLTIDGVVWTPPSGWEFSPQVDQATDDDEHTSARAADSEDADRIQLIFAPDGTASAVHFSLLGDDKKRGWDFDISSFTGRMTIRPIQSTLIEHDQAQ